MALFQQGFIGVQEALHAVCAGLGVLIQHQQVGEFGREFQCPARADVEAGGETEILGIGDEHRALVRA